MESGGYMSKVDVFITESSQGSYLLTVIRLLLAFPGRLRLRRLLIFLSLQGVNCPFAFAARRLCVSWGAAKTTYYCSFVVRTPAGVSFVTTGVLGWAAFISNSGMSRSLCFSSVQVRLLDIASWRVRSVARVHAHSWTGRQD